MTLFRPGRRPLLLVAVALVIATAGGMVAADRLLGPSTRSEAGPTLEAAEPTLQESLPEQPSDFELPEPEPTLLPPILTSMPSHPDRPTSFAAVTTAGDLVVASSRNGRVLRTLVRKSGLKRRGEIIGLALTPDRSTVYFDIWHDDWCHTIASVPYAGGAVRKVAAGALPSVSADGRKLAYTDLHNCGSKNSRVVVRDLTSGQERSWAEEPTDDDSSLGMKILWSPNPHHLLVWSCGVDNCQAISLDTASKARTVHAASRQIPDEHNGFWHCTAVRTNHGTVVARAAYNDVDSGERLLEIDLRSGKSRTLVADARGLGCFEFDATGDRALFLGPGDVLYEWTPRGIWAIGPGFGEAVW